jgi:spore maturation protein CgeB
MTLASTRGLSKQKATNLLFLLAGREGYTSWMRAEAARRIGFKVTTIQMLDCIPANLWAHRIHRRLGFSLLQYRVRNFIKNQGIGEKYDVCWVDHGNLIGLSAAQDLKKIAKVLLNYNVDDPTGKRDGWHWNSYLRSLPVYDLVVTVRRETENELRARGAAKVLRVFRSYDEFAHRPLQLSNADMETWGSEVVFVGTWMEDRDDFIWNLAERGIPISVYGDNWEKAPRWNMIKHLIRGRGVFGENYAKILQSAKVCLCLLSRGNRDQHTQRSLEIPAMESVLCAERTGEHLELFEDGKECVLWNDVDECARRCRELLEKPTLRASIACAGRAKVQALQLGHEAVIKRILSTVGIGDLTIDN